MSDGTGRAAFTRMRDGTAEEYALIHAREAAYNRTLHLRVLEAVRALGTAEPDPGYAVSRLAHSLQSASRPSASPAPPASAGRGQAQHVGPFLRSEPRR